MLGLARATVCEMLQVLEELDLISRAPYRRTNSITLTRRGERALDAAEDECIHRGNVAVAVDAAIARGNPSIDTEKERDEILDANFALRQFFGDASREELHRFDWYDNLGCITWFELRDEVERGPVPWVDEVMLPRASFSG